MRGWDHEFVDISHRADLKLYEKGLCFALPGFCYLVAKYWEAD